MTIAGDPGYTAEQAALLCRLLAAKPVLMPSSMLSESELDDAVDLQLFGLVLLIDGADGEPGVMLSPVLAARAGFETTGFDGERWEPIRPALPETAAIIARDEKRKCVRLVNETDLAAKAKRKGGKVETPIDRAWGPIDDGGFRRPSNLLGTGTIWEGPDTGNLAGRPDRLCQVCGMAEIDQGDGCLKCERRAGEKPKRLRAKKAG